MQHSLAALADLPYRPASPRHYQPRIGLIGCGGITREHLRAYQAAGFQVTALCDLDVRRAREKAAAYYPEAAIFEDYRLLLRDESIEVVDIATHPPDRPPIIKAALLANKHVLSQKPFVLDLDEGAKLVELAHQRNRQLAINQNGRWAPHFSYARLASQQGLLGDVFGVHLNCHWDHTWVKGTEFERIKYLILYDYAIHWFDIVRAFLPGKEAKRVYASTAPVPGQTLMPHLLSQAMIEFDEAQCSLAFDAGLPVGSLDQTFLSGTQGSLHSVGPDIQSQAVTVATSHGRWSPRLIGQWFPDGFHGTMGELLCAVEERRESSINAEDNLKSLALCFAAIASVELGKPIVPGSVRRLPG
jgi:predicted dehydrogenase